MSGGEALRLARRLSALPEPIMRERVFLEYLHRSEAKRVVHVLDEIYHRGRDGGPPFNIALLTIATVLSQNTLSYELMSALYTSAREAELETVSQLLLSGQPTTVEFSRREEQRELTLGHRKSLARSTDRDVLHRLLMNPEPEVVHNLLENPRITEPDVVLLAARRPAFAEVQLKIFNSQRWIQRYHVKRALVLNPYTPSDLSLRLVSFLNHGDLRLVASSPTLTQPLREAAVRLQNPQ